MRRTVYLSKALIMWICVICAILIIGIWPFRVFRRAVTVGESQASRIISEAVDDEHTVRQYFRAQYDKIDSVTIYISELEGGRYMALALQKGGYSSLCSRFVDLQGEQIPGHVTVKLGVTLEPGEQYNILLKGRYSSFRTAYVSTKEAPLPAAENYYYNQTAIPDARLACQITYDLPLSKESSLVLIGIVFFAGIVLSGFIRFVFSKKPQAEVLLMTGDLVFYPVALLLVLAYTVLFLMNYPLQIFDNDPLEISFYAVGILLAALLSLYALRRFCTGEKRPDSLNGRELTAAALMALALKYACDYMNGTYDLAHYISIRQMIICLLLMILVLLPVSVLVRPIHLFLTLIASVLAFMWTRGQVSSSEEKMVAEVYLQINLTAVLVVLLFLVLLCLSTEVFRNIKHRLATADTKTLYTKIRRVPWYLILTLVTGLGMIAFRNTRLWIPVIVCLYTLIYLGARKKVFSGRWFLIVQNGVYIHFICTVGYCLLHRAFQNYVFNRYGMVFSTVTVTAQYTAMVCAVTVAGLANRLRVLGYRGQKGAGIRRMIREAWKELLLFGLAHSYMLFSISRQSTVAVSALLVVLLMLQFFDRSSPDEEGRETGHAKGTKSIKKAAVLLTAFVLSTLMVFPAAFTLQRTIPSLVGEQHVLPDIEAVSGYPFYEDMHGTAPFLLGKVVPNSAAYIRIRRFYHIFAYRMFGTEFVFDWYQFDSLNYDENDNLKYDLNGEAEDKEDLSRDIKNVTEDEESTILDTATTYQEKKRDISNGRFEVFRSYLSSLNMTGHKSMTGDGTVGLHAHNIYLQTAYDCGIPVGILFFVWIGITMICALTGYIKEIRRHIKQEERASSYLLILSVSVSFAMIGMFDLCFGQANPCTVIFMVSIAPLILLSGRNPIDG